MARLLGESFLEHHPASTFTVLVVDDEPCDFGADIETARLADLDLDAASLSTMKTIYDVMEFSTAVKPSFLRLLLRSQDETGIACYLDPDIQVFSNFDAQVEPAIEHGIVLTPHALEPVPRDGMNVSEGTIMQSGMYNCGFLAVSNQGRAFLDWWDERLRFDAVVDFEQSHFTDQRWVDWVPSLFDYQICRDSGMNVAWWNIHERPIDASVSPPAVVAASEAHPVRFVHFSGFDPQRPDVLSKHQLPAPRVDHAVGTGMRTLSDAYAARLIELGHVERRRSAYPWNRSDDGVELTTEVRRRVRNAVLEEVAAGRTVDDRGTPDGFGGGNGSLGEWLANLDAAGAPSASAPPLVASTALRRDGELAVTARAALKRARSVGGRVTELVQDRLADRRSANHGGSNQADASTEGGVRPFAFLHVPKSAGSSVVASLRTGLADHRWSDHVFDPTWMGPYRNDERPAGLRHQVLEDRADLQGVDAVAGHFTLATLQTRFDLGDIATVVREPRCRLLSHYEYWRGLTDEARTAELPWQSSTSAVHLDFADWLLDESIAYQTDNVLIRLLVDDPAIPDNSFIPNEALARVARIASTKIRRLGFVGLVEQGDGAFDGLGAFVGVPLERQRLNVTRRASSLPVDIDAVFERAVPALAARTAGDALVWSEAARRVGVADPDVVAQAAWMRRLGEMVRNGGTSRG